MLAKRSVSGTIIQAISALFNISVAIHVIHMVFSRLLADDPLDKPLICYCICSIFVFGYYGFLSISMQVPFEFSYSKEFWLVSLVPSTIGLLFLFRGLFLLFSGKTCLIAVGSHTTPHILPFLTAIAAIYSPQSRYGRIFLPFDVNLKRVEETAIEVEESAIEVKETV